MSPHLLVTQMIFNAHKHGFLSTGRTMRLLLGNEAVDKQIENLIPLPEKKKGGESVSPLANSGNVTSVVKRVDSVV